MDWDKFCSNAAAFLAGLFMLEFGADRFIEHTAITARRLGVSQTLIALLTAGAEWEELAVVIAAVIQHRSPLALGNVIGSTISNILGAFSLGLLFHPGQIFFDKSSKIYTALLLFLTTVFVALALFGKVNKVTGGAMVSAFGLYVISVSIAIYRGMLVAPEVSDDEGGSESGDESRNDWIDGEPASSVVSQEEHLHTHSESSALLADDGATPTPHVRCGRRVPHTLIYHICQLLIGFVALSISGYVLSHSASAIADTVYLSGTVFGITVLSFATTLPEKFVAIVGGSRGYSGIIVANTAGSNIFLLTLCLGIVILNGDLESSVVPFELAVMWASSAIFFSVVFFGLGRWTGVVLIVLYVVFLVLEFTIYRR